MQKTGGGVTFKKHMIKRFKRIVPPYWFCLIVVLLIGDGSYYLKQEEIYNIVTHFLFIHNLFPGSFGAINGALWTMGVIFQFYLVAIIIYKAFGKIGETTVLVSIVLTVLFKMITYRYINPYLGHGSDWAFWTGRQLTTALDNFVIGCGVAYLCEYYGAAEPPVRCGESHLSGLTEPPHFVYEITLPLLDPVRILLS